ncbi:MAG: hypothetical protein QOF31_5719, partial [Mycobacterium sp.]|nr:hypothetical protein [Mycobacterium sp.]
MPGRFRPISEFAAQTAALASSAKPRGRCPAHAGPACASLVHKSTGARKIGKIPLQLR